MSLRRFKRLQSCSIKLSDKEVCILTTCSNTDNDIFNNTKTFKTTIENSNHNNSVSENPAIPHNQINLSQQIELDIIDTTDRYITIKQLYYL